jgi:YrbI family 3-deoxy-D-manno-octulosonate 8-phosphate phosphatase
VPSLPNNPPGPGRPAPARGVKVVVCDVDGVLTDGSIALDAGGGEAKSFSVIDGFIIHHLKRAGIQVGMLSGRKSAVVARRAEDLGLSFYRDGVIDKKPALLEAARSAGCSPAELCYIGDDLIDIPCLMMCGFPVAVADARPEVKSVAAYITRALGGQGAVRETAEVILKAQNRWEEILERYRS